MVSDKKFVPPLPLTVVESEGQFEILYWNPYYDRWRPVGSWGSILALRDALEFIAEDPMDCFWR